MIDRIGRWDIYVLETGLFKLDGGAMMGSVPKVLWEKTNPADDKNRIDLSLRCLFLDDGENRILIETGMGNKFNSKFKDIFRIKQSNDPLTDALSAYDFCADDVTDVILTHLHFDHAGGATRILENGSIVPTFKNAKYFVSETNWDLGINPNDRDRASYIFDNYIPLRDAGVLNLIKDNSEIFPGISTIVVNGHTIGQQLVKVSSGLDTLVFCSDLIPLRSHLSLPWIMGYDLNALLTLKEKTDFLDLAANNNWWLFFYHDPKTIAVKVSKGEKYYDVVKEVFKK